MKRTLGTFILAVTLIATLLIAGCGTPATPTATSTTPTTTAPASKTTTLVTTPAATSPSQTTSTSTQPQVFQLKAGSHFPPVSGQSKMLDAYLQELTKRTNGALKITYYPGATLLPQEKLYDGAANGMVDIAMAGLHFTPGRFPTMTLLYNPFGYPSGWIASHVVNDFYQQYNPKELQDTHPLFLTASAPLIIITKKPVKTLEDMKGLTIRSTDLNNDIVTALGATPRNMPIPDAYDGASKGLIDGFLLPPEALVQWHLADVTANAALSMAVSSTDTFVITMNNDTWKKLPADIQKTVTDVSKEYVETAAVMWETVNQTGYDLGKQKTINFITLSNVELDRWKAAAAGVIAAHNEKQATGGTTKTDLEQRGKFVSDRINFWQQEQAKTGIGAKIPTAQ